MRGNPVFETPQDLALELETMRALATCLLKELGRPRVYRKLPDRYCADFAITLPVTKKVTGMIEVKNKTKHWDEAYFSASKALTLTQFTSLGMPVYLCMADPVEIRFGSLEKLITNAPLVWAGRNKHRTDMDCEPCYAIPPDRWLRHYSWPKVNAMLDIRECDNSA